MSMHDPGMNHSHLKSITKLDGMLAKIYQQPFKAVAIYHDKEGREGLDDSIIFVGYRIVDCSGLLIATVPGEAAKHILLEALN